MTLTPTRHACDTSDMRIPHAVLRENLADPERIILTAGPDPSRVEPVGAYYGAVLDFLHLHHTAEDVVLWPRLRERVPDRKELLDRMESQHTAIGAATIAAQAALDDYRSSPTPVNARTLVSAINTLNKVMEAHLSEEERSILPLAAVSLDQDEWDQMPSYALSHYRGGRPWLLLGLLFDEMTPAEREEMLARLPMPLLQIWEDDGPQRYRDLMSVVRPATLN